MGDVGCAAVADGTDGNPSETGNIAVFKFLCEDIGQQDTCNGRDTSLAGFTIDFQIFAGEGTEGDLVETVTVTLGENAGGGGNTGGGSQGRIVSGDLPVGTFTVCEVEVAIGPNGEEVPLEAFPRPTAGEGGSTGGTNQEQLGENCIVVDLTPGTAELKFLDLRAEVADDGDDKTDATDDGADDAAADDGDGAADDGTGASDDDGDANVTVNALPSTGQGSNGGDNTAEIALLLGAISLVALTAGFAWRQGRSS